ncbi:MAG: ABC transporter ATP-binding protein [Clostridium sp.]|nr:ABC transporter ATP-binding protein [Clostridium sp.]MCM1398346.1 ABC transporter ATP-binding protein [Clostridium sp.]MCM1458989.1 ABC transporter ATP-binding protein [Bacteroides sp.]
MKKEILCAKNLCKTFPQGGQETQILKSISMEIYENDFTVIMGASGAGKSTLLYALSGMDDITSGTLTFQGKRMDGLSENKMATLRANAFGFVFQQTHLVSNLTLFENVAVAGAMGKNRNERAVRERALKLLAQMHVDNAKDRLPSQVSGGEAQRAAIARAMMNEPQLIFADEPTGALNKSNSEEVLNLLTELSENGQSILMVTHDIKAAIRANRILYLEDGQLLDELSLPSYCHKDEKEREAKVNKWLASLRW